VNHLDHPHINFLETKGPMRRGSADPQADLEAEMAKIGAGGPAGNVPYNPSLFGPKQKKVKKEGRADVPSFCSYGKPGGPDGSKARFRADGSGNYEAKRSRLESLLSERKLSLQQEASKPGDGFDEYAFEKSALGQKILLADDAIRSTSKKLSVLTPKVQVDEAQYTETNKALNAQIALINSKRKALKPVTAEDNAELTALRNRHREARKVYHEDKTAFLENERAKKAATDQKSQDVEALARLDKTRLSERRAKFLAEQQAALKSGVITRPQYETNLKEAVGRVTDNSPDAPALKEALTDSETTRTNAGKDLHKKTLLIDGRDFDAQREELEEYLQEQRANGVSETEIVAYEAKRREQIRHAEFEKHHEEQRAAHRADYESGTQTLDQYRSYLVSLLESVQTEYGQTSAEAAKLNLEIMKLDWDEASQGADRLRESLDQGDISLQEYVVGLEALRGTLPTVSNEYRRMSRDIDGANRKMVQDARRSADEMGRAFGDATVQILRRSKSVGQVAKETLDSAVDGWIKDTVTKVVSRVVLKGKLQNNAKEMKAAAEQRAADTQVSAADKQLAAADKQLAGAAAMGQQVERLAGAANQMAGAVGSGGTAKTAGATTAVEGALGVAGQAAGAAGNKKTQDAISKTSTAISTVKQAASGDMGGAVSTAASAGWLGKAAAKAMPWVGVGLAAISLLGGAGLFSSQYRGFSTKEGGSVFSKIGKGDHTGLIDSGLSGPDGLRQLAAKAEAQKAQMSAPKISNMNIAQGAIVINTLPGQNSREIVDMLMKELSDKAAMENSGRGSSY
jgi:hypothetical protein